MPGTCALTLDQTHVGAVMRRDMSCKEPARDHQCSSRRPGPPDAPQGSQRGLHTDFSPLSHLHPLLESLPRCETGIRRPSMGTISLTSPSLSRLALMLGMLAAAQQAVPAEPVQHHRQCQQYRISKSYVNRHWPVLAGLCMPELRFIVFDSTSLACLRQ